MGGPGIRPRGWFMLRKAISIERGPAAGCLYKIAHNRDFLTGNLDV